MSEATIQLTHNLAGSKRTAGLDERLRRSSFAKTGIWSRAAWRQPRLARAMLALASARRRSAKHTTRHVLRLQMQQGHFSRCGTSELVVIANLLTTKLAKTRWPDPIGFAKPPTAA